MNDYKKTKIAFAVALLAALFTTTPILNIIGSWGFDVFGNRIEVIYIYYFIAVSLAISVYIYGLQFLT